MTSMIPKQDNSLSANVLHDWKKAAASWLDNLGSEDTRRAYGQSWSTFLSFAGVAPGNVTQDDIIAYRRHLETTTSQKTGKPYTQTTINLRLSALSSFFAFAKDRGLRPDNPTDGVKRKAVDPYGKATWLRSEDGEDIRLLEAMDDSPKGLRDRAIILLFLTLALRLHEVAGLSVGSLNRQGNKTFLTYIQKGGKTKVVKLPEETAEAIDAYLETRGNLTNSSPLFTASEAGRGAARRLGHTIGEESPLTPRAIAGLVKSYCDRVLGKGHGIHPHSLRHTAAMIAAKNGHSIMDVSDLLGHASLAVTTIYLHATGRATDKVAADLGRRYSKENNIRGES